MADEWAIDELFDDDYLHFYAPLLTDEVSDTQAALIWSLLALEPGAHVLDVACGHGRIANRLAARGADVTGLDATPLFLERATDDATRRSLGATYVHGDMRSLPWTSAFDAIVCWFTAFGYFDDEQNQRVLTEVHRALRPGGRFLVELNYKDGLLPHWLPSSVARVGADLMIDERTYDPLTGRANAVRTIVRDGSVRKATFFIRMFGFTELRDWLLDAGFTAVDGYDGGGGTLRADSTRMIVIART